jgi:hypothetical protein
MVWCVLTPLLSTFQYPEEMKMGRPFGYAANDPVVKHVLFTIGACRPEDRQPGLAEQELMS